VSIGTPDFRPLSPAERRQVVDLRSALFLACLSKNVRLKGANAGYSTYTADNFEPYAYSIRLDSPYFAESSGALVEVIHGGYRYGEVQFPTPAHVPRPTPFNYDKNLFRAVEGLRGPHGRLYRRIMRACALFIESFYNTRSFDIAARILLQVAAFEVLLDLPDTQHRRAFKDAVERLCNNDNDRRYRHKFEDRGKKRWDSRSQKGIWADRFYSLRNRIIHGDNVPRSAYHYKGQHHVWIAPVFFVFCVERLITEAMASKRAAPSFFDRIDWARGKRYGSNDGGGFRLDTDWGARIEDLLARGGEDG
jgi:hypothetical protein